MDFFLKINKGASTSIRYTRVPLLLRQKKQKNYKIGLWLFDDVEVEAGRWVQRQNFDSEKKSLFKDIQLYYILKSKKCF